MLIQVKRIKSAIMITSTVRRTTKDTKAAMLAHVRSEFHSIVDTFDIANIFLQSTSEEVILYDTGEKGKRYRKSYKAMCAGLKQEIAALSETVSLLEDCVTECTKEA